MPGSEYAVMTTAQQDLLEEARALELAAQRLRTLAYTLGGAQEQPNKRAASMRASEDRTRGAALAAAISAHEAWTEERSAEPFVQELTRLVRNLRMQAHTRRAIGDDVGSAERMRAYRHFNGYLKALRRGPLPALPEPYVNETQTPPTTR